MFTELLNSQLLKRARAERKPAAASEKTTRQLSDTELDYVAGGAGNPLAGAGGGDDAQLL